MTVNNFCNSGEPGSTTASIDWSKILMTFDKDAPIRGSEDLNLVRSLNDAPTIIEMMLKCIQAICATYGEHVDNFKSSFFDREPFQYLIDFYLLGHMFGTQCLKEAKVIDPLELVENS